MENPLSLKVGQVFTGFGVGCGIGVGVGQPIPFGSIPALQQVVSAARGATDPFVGVTRYFNGYMKKLGLKHIEAGVGCGVGVGHGFGVGLALKPRVIHQIQSSLGQAVGKIMVHLGITPTSPSISSVGSIIPGPLPSSIDMLSGTSGISEQTSTISVADLVSKSTGSSLQHSMKNYGSMQRPSEVSVGTSSEKVINTFLQNPLIKNKEETELNELAGKLRSENNLLQVWNFQLNQLLKHQQAIEELEEENQKLRRILVEDLKVSASKLQTNSGSRMKFDYPCPDCFECRRRKRRSAR